MNILEYIRSKVRVNLTEDNVRTILLDRDLLGDETSDASSLDAMTRELLYADALMILSASPDSWGGETIQHGGFTHRIGSENISRQDIYAQMAMDIYKKWDDDRYVNEDRGISWIDNEY